MQGVITCYEAVVIRPRRSALYVPGSYAKALEKAPSLAADVLIYDLEDAVAPSAKAAAREALRHNVAGTTRAERVLRVNAASTPWNADDLQLAAQLPVDAVLLPKVESAREVRDAEAQLEALGASSKRLWCMIETPRGVLSVDEIAGASEKIEALVMGTSDLVKELRCKHVPGREPLLYALSRTVLAARALGRDVLDGVHLDLDDLAGLEESCRQGLRLGFDGKTLIHPKTIEAANRVFSPDPEAIAEATRVIAAYSEAEQRGSGVAVLDGRLIERLHAEEARRVLALARAIAAAPA